MTSRHIKIFKFDENSTSESIENTINEFMEDKVIVNVNVLDLFTYVVEYKIVH